MPARQALAKGAHLVRDARIQLPKVGKGGRPKPYDQRLILQSIVEWILRVQRPDGLVAPVRRVGEVLEHRSVWCLTCWLA